MSNSYSATPKAPEYKVPRKSLGFQNTMSAILSPPFWIPKIRCQIHIQRPQKLLSTEFRGNRVISKIACPTFWISAILRRTWLFEIGETIFSLQFNYSDHHWSQLGSSPNTLLARKKIMQKKIPIFWYFSQNLAPYWISYWTKLNFDHEFLNRIPKTITKHGFRLEISLFQSWEWGLNTSKKTEVELKKFYFKQYCVKQVQLKKSNSPDANVHHQQGGTSCQHSYNRAFDQLYEYPSRCRRSAHRRNDCDCL